jgi:hypothetical protein
MSIAVIEERRKVLDEKRFKESQYLSAINFYIFDDVILSSPQKKSLKKKSIPKKPAVSIKPVPYSIPALSLDLTSTLTTISTLAKELEATAPKSSIVVPSAMPAITRNKRTIKRRGSSQ